MLWAHRQGSGSSHQHLNQGFWLKPFLCCVPLVGQHHSTVPHVVSQCGASLCRALHPSALNCKWFQRCHALSGVKAPSFVLLITSCFLLVSGGARSTAGNRLTEWRMFGCNSFWGCLRFPLASFAGTFSSQALLSPSSFCSPCALAGPSLGQGICSHHAPPGT